MEKLLPTGALCLLLPSRSLPFTSSQEDAAVGLSKTGSIWPPPGHWALRSRAPASSQPRGFGTGGRRSSPPAQVWFALRGCLSEGVCRVYLRITLFTARGESCPTLGGGWLPGQPRPGLVRGTAPGGPGVNKGRDGGPGRGSLPALPLLPDPAVLGPLAIFLTALWPLDIPHLSFLKILCSVTYQSPPGEPVLEQ